ncbi:MAG: DUF4340 domain-containing protein, partial [Clostridia bacterium]|nr:DUF4340 domain-containing protein [Clostridia bacterium]
DNGLEPKEESTVFSAPAEHNDGSLKSPKKSRIIAVLAALLAVCALVGGTLAVIKLIPKKEDESDGEEIKKLTVFDFDKEKLDSFTVENGNGKFVFCSAVEDSSESSETSGKYWYLEGFEMEKLSDSKIGSIVSAAAKMEAIIEITQKSREDCGISAAALKVNVTSGELGDYSFTFGDVSPDNTGIYLYSSVDEKIYLVALDVSQTFSFTALDLANTDAVSPITNSSEYGDYVDNGNLVSLDSLTLSGKVFDKPVVIKMLSEEDASKLGFAYRVISPMARYADSQVIDTLLTPYVSGISVSGAYSLDTDAASLKAFGLDNPDFSLKLVLGTHTVTYSFSEQSDGFYAACGDGMNTVKKVSSSAVEFMSVREKDIYNKMVYIRPLAELKNMTFNVPDAVYSFDISENGEDDEEKFTVTLGKKSIKSDYFQNFYVHFVSLSLFDFSADKTTVPDMTVIITDNDGATETLAFYRTAATEYTCTLDGAPVGKITASAYNSLVGDIKTVSENKDVEN